MTYARRLVHVNPDTVNVKSCLRVIESLELSRPVSEMSELSLAYSIRNEKQSAHSSIFGWNQSRQFRFRARVHASVWGALTGENGDTCSNTFDILWGPNRSEHTWPDYTQACAAIWGFKPDIQLSATVVRPIVLTRQVGNCGIRHED